MKKRLLKRMTSLLLVTLLLLSAVPTASLTALAASLNGDDESGYSVNMPATGSDTLDLSGKTDGFTFNLYDDGGAESDYSNYCNGALIITVDEGLGLRISGSARTENNYDFLYIYDGATTDPLGEEQYSGQNISIDALYSSANSLTVKFTSDYSGTNPGLDLRVTVIDPSKYATVFYFYAWSTKSYMAAKGSEITLPTFASLFTMPEGSTFRGWKLGETLYNENAAFTVTDDVTFTAQAEEPPVVISDGENGYYSLVPASGTNTADLSVEGAPSVLKVYDSGGVSEDYPNDADGCLFVVAPAGALLSVTGTYDTEANYDYLWLYDGNTETESVKISGRDQTLEEFTTTGNVLKIRFSSDNSNYHSGLDLSVSIVDTSSYVTLSFDHGEGSGTMNNIFAPPGTEVVIPNCGFTAPEGKVFLCYTDGVNTYNAGETYTLGATKTLTAVYAAKATVTYQYGEYTQTADYAQGTEIQLDLRSHAGEREHQYRPHRSEKRVHLHSLRSEQIYLLSPKPRRYADLHRTRGL